MKLKSEWVKFTQSCLTLQLHALWDTPPPFPRLLCPWDSPGKNTGVGCHALLQGIFPTQGSNTRLLHWQPDSLPLSHLGSPGSLKGEKGGGRDVMKETKSEWGSWPLLAWRREEGGHEPKNTNLQQVNKVEETHSPWRLHKECSPVNTLIFASETHRTLTSWTVRWCVLL